MLILGKGTDPNSEAAIAFDKLINKEMDAKRPTGGYPPEQEKALAASKARVTAYESEHGIVDPDEVEARQEAQFDAGLDMMENLIKQMRPNG